MKKIIMTLIVLVIYVNYCFGYALNYGFLDDTAGVYFTDKDWELFEKAQLRALNNTRDGIKSTWKNTQTGSWGSFVPSQSHTTKGKQCRELTIVNAANYRVGQSTLTFCKVNGEWKGV
jgi:hypothetical protein